MRNMIQLLGGVAVAGAVAAGTTAFTATGVGGSVTAIGGGVASITTVGATLNSAEFLQDTSAPANYDHITGIKVNVTATPALGDANTKVSVAITGGGAAGAASSGTYYDCGAGSSGTWTCTIGTPATDYFTSVTAVSVKVAAKA